MAVGDIGAALIDRLQLLNGSQVSLGEVVHATGDFFACVYRQTAGVNVFRLDTFAVDDSGNIPAVVQDSITVSATAATNAYPSMVKVEDGLVALTWDANVAGVGPFIATYPIDSSGNIGAQADIVDIATSPLRNEVTIEATEHSGLFVIQYLDAASELIIRTFTIDSGGNISAFLDTRTINTTPTAGQRGRLVWTGQGDFYAIPYTDSATGDGFIQTHTISSLGIIGAVTDTLEFDTTSAAQLQLASNDAGRLTIFYVGTANNIIVRTVNVDSSGNMTNGNTLTSFVNLNTGIDFIRIDEDTKDNFLGVADDNARSYNIDGAGTPTQIDLLQFIGEIEFSASVVRKPGITAFVVMCGYENLFGVDDFWVMTLAVESVDAPAAGGSSAQPNMIQREVLLL